MQAREYKLDKHLQMDGFIQAGLQFSSLSKLDFEQQWVGYSFKLRWTQRWLFYPLNHRCSLKFYYHLSFLQISSLLSPCQSSMMMHASLKLDWNQKAMGPLFFPANILIPGFGVGPGNNLHLFPLVHDVGGYHGGKPGADRIVIQHHPPDPAAGVHHDCA